MAHPTPRWIRGNHHLAVTSRLNLTSLEAQKLAKSLSYYPCWGYEYQGQVVGGAIYDNSVTLSIEAPMWVKDFGFLLDRLFQLTDQVEYRYFMGWAPTKRLGDQCGGKDNTTSAFIGDQTMWETSEFYNKIHRKRLKQFSLEEKVIG